MSARPRLEGQRLRHCVCLWRSGTALGYRHESDSWPILRVPLAQCMTLAHGRLNSAYNMAYSQSDSAYRSYYNNPSMDASPELSPSPRGTKYHGHYQEEEQYDDYDVEYEQEQASADAAPSGLGGLSIPVVASNKENHLEDGLLSPRRIAQQVDAFGAMCNAGAGWGAAARII